MQKIRKTNGWSLRYLNTERPTDQQTDRVNYIGTLWINGGLKLEKTNRRSLRYLKTDYKGTNIPTDRPLTDKGYLHRTPLDILGSKMDTFLFKTS